MGGIRGPWRVWRLAVLGGAALFAAVLASASCQTPTQIVVDVRTDACPQVKTTDVAVGSSESALVQKGETQTSVKGCYSPDNGKIGTLVLLPDGNEDKEVVFRVVTGITKPASECKAEGEKGCIFAKRRARFIENEIVPVLVVMSTLCDGVACGEGTSCNATTGQCDATPCVGSGCEQGRPDAGTDGNGAMDAALDGVVFDPGDAGCSTSKGCKGICASGVCKVECTTANPCTSPCQPGLPCNVLCLEKGACNGVSCGNASECKIYCKAKDACDGVRCGSAGTCNVECTAPGGCKNEVFCSTDSPTCEVTCVGGAACTPALKTVFCCGAKPPNGPCLAPANVTTKNQCN